MIVSDQCFFFRVFRDGFLRSRSSTFFFAAAFVVVVEALLLPLALGAFGVTLLGICIIPSSIYLGGIIVHP